MLDDIPNRPWNWWWRARYVLNSEERRTLEAEAEALRRKYEPDLRVLRRRAAMRLVGRT